MRVGLKLRLCGGVAIAGLMLAGTAMADDFVVGNGQTETTTQTLPNLGDTLLIEQGGTVSTDTDGVGAVNMLTSGQTTTNDGSITTSGIFAFGINSNDADATISNNGSITTSGEEFAFGIFSIGADATISNDGSITTSGVPAHGINSNGADATISNDGSITTSGNIASGIVSTGADATISNSGSITTSGVGAFGIGSTGADATISNSGSIISLQFNAIEMAGTNATLNLLAGSVLQGGIRFDQAGSATLNIGPGLNTALTLTGTPDTINVNGMAYIDAGNAVLDGNLLAVVDVTGFAATDEMITDLTRSITGSVEGHLAARRSCHGHGDGRVAMGGMAIAPVADMPPVPMTCGTGLWGSVFGGFSDVQATSSTSDAEHGFGGLVVGYDLALSAATTGGLFAGFSKGEVTTPQAGFANDITGAYGGAYVSHVTEGGMFFDLSVTAGVLINETERLITNNEVEEGGLETASADHDGIMFSPSMKVGFNQGMYGSTLTPSVRVRYAGLYLDGYEETGSSVNLTVSDRDVHVVEVRGELALALATREVDSGFWHTQIKGGVDGIFNWGDDVNAELLDTDITFAAGDEDEVIRGFGGALAVFTSHGGTQFTSGIEVGYDSAETFTADARLGVNVPF